MKHIAMLLVGVILVSHVSVAGATKEFKMRHPKDIEKSKKKGITVILRETHQTITLAPGEIGTVASACLDDEAVVGGAPTGMPASLAVAVSTLFFDGVHSGWLVDFRNDGTESTTETPVVGALCVPGRLITE
jgi:hypothetical protein